MAVHAHSERTDGLYHTFHRHLPASHASYGEGVRRKCGVYHHRISYRFCHRTTDMGTYQRPHWQEKAVVYGDGYIYNRFYRMRHVRLHHRDCYMASVSGYGCLHRSDALAFDGTRFVQSHGGCKNVIGTDDHPCTCSYHSPSCRRLLAGHLVVEGHILADDGSECHTFRSSILLARNST